MNPIALRLSAMAVTLEKDWPEIAVALEVCEREIIRLDADAARYRWLCDGHGYFMEENMLCGHGDDKDAADKAIDAARGVSNV